MSETIINDIVHGIIELPDYIKVIIDTDQFQRLRYISQLGFDSFVYPSAGYSRFEHSIGTFHLASKLIKQIKEQLDKDRAGIDISDVPKVTEDDIKCVEIAALCHDLGHGPYSHFWEHAFDEGIPTRKHEELSAEIFKELMDTIKDNESIKNIIGLKDKIARIISGKIIDEDDKKYFLFEIVANKKSGLDVDKFDYLCRDSIYLGWSNKNKIHDVKRIMHFLRVAKFDERNNERNDEKNEWHLAMRDREIFHIHDVFYYRHLLHRYGYQHKTVKAIECLFKNAIKEIVDNKEYKELRKEFIKNVLNETDDKDDPNIWFSTKFISKVCDHHVWEIMKKHPNGIVKQIQKRNLIKLHCQIQVIRKVTNQNGNIQHDMKSLTDILKEKYKVKYFEIPKFCFQSEDKGNPLLAVRFYKKNDNTKYIYMKEEDLPDMMKSINDEFIIMIFKDGNEDIKSLDEIIENLCSGNSDKINEEIIKDLLRKYKFRKNKY